MTKGVHEPHHGNVTPLGATLYPLRDVNRRSTQTLQMVLEDAMVINLRPSRIGTRITTETDADGDTQQQCRFRKGPPNRCVNADLSMVFSCSEPGLGLAIARLRR